MRGEIIEFFIIKQIKKPRICPVCRKALEKRQSTQENTQQSRVSPHLFCAYRFLCALKQNVQSTVEVSLLVNESEKTIHTEDQNGQTRSLISDQNDQSHSHGATHTYIAPICEYPSRVLDTRIIKKCLVGKKRN